MVSLMTISSSSISRSQQLRAPVVLGGRRIDNKRQTLFQAVYN